MSELGDRVVDKSSRRVRNAEIVVDIGGLGNDGAEIGAADDSAAGVGGRPNTGSLVRRGGIGAIEQPKIEIKPLDDPDRRPVVETLRTPFGNAPQVDDRSGNGLAEIEQRMDAEF